MRQYRQQFNAAIEQEFAMMDEIEVLRYNITVLQAAAKIFDELDNLDRAEQFEELIEAVKELERKRKVYKLQIAKLSREFGKSDFHYDVLNHVLSSLNIEDDILVKSPRQFKHYGNSRRNKEIVRILAEKK